MLRALSVILFVAVCVVGMYAYSWKWTAEAMVDRVCARMLARGTIDASIVLKQGETEAAIVLLKALRDEAGGYGRVCNNRELRELGWSFPFFELATGVSGPEAGRAFDPEIHALLFIAHNRKGESEASRKVLLDLARTHYRGDELLAENFLRSYEETVLTLPDARADVRGD